MLTVRSTINIASQTVPPIIPVVQGDTGRAILFTLADFTIPAGATATYYVQKPSGEAVYNNATIDGNNVLVNLTAQSIIEKGDNYGQARITVGEEVVTSFDFILLVKEFRGIDAVQSLTEMNIFDKAVEQASEAIDEVKTDALEAIDDAKDEAIEEVTSNFDLKLDASSTKGVQNQVITQAINTVNNAIGDLSGETVTPTATNNYGVGGNVGQVIETWATTEYWHGIYTVSAGNTYGITTVSDFPQQLVVWFTNASNTIIENHKAFATDHVEMVCTAPTGATKLYVMSYGYDAYHGTVQKVEPLSETVSNLKDDLTLLKNGEEWIEGDWKVGTLIRATGAYYLGNYTYRIATPDFVTFAEDTKYTISNGYALQVYKFNADGTKDGNPVDYTGTYSAPKNTKLKFVILTNPEDTSVAADVTKFRSKVTRVSDIQKQINALDSNVADMEEAYQKYLKNTEVTLNFSSHAIDSTYQAEWFDCDIAVGETVQIEIVCPNNDANTSYLNFNAADNNRLNPSALYAGTATRTVKFTNGYTKAVAKIGLTLVKVNAQNTYSVSVYKEPYLPKRVDALKNEVDSIMDTIGDIETVPAYFKDQLESAIGTAQTNMLSAGINGETFVLISDIHWESNQKHSPVLIGEVNKALNIENTIFGGDAINGGTQAQTIANMNEIRQKFGSNTKRFLSVFGNHDSNAQDGGVVFTNREFYTLLQKQNDYNVTYIYPYFYYMDNPATKTRMIFLDTGMTNPSNPTAEMTWLQNAITGASNGWHIIIFAHVIYTPSGGDYGDPSTYTMTSFMTDVCEYLDSINTAGQKTVDAIFGGHCHLDYDSATSGGIPIIMIDTDSSQTNSDDGYAIGTITEQCFDIVTVNYSAKAINCARVGRGQNRSFTY